MWIALVRHGETDWNRMGRMQGLRDIPLNEAGLRQASECGRQLCPGDWGAVVTSPLCRARRTAELLAEQAGISRISEDAGLVERNYGLGTGLTAAERESRFPEGTCPGMETGEAMADRMIASLRRIAERFFPENVVVVSHGSAIQALLARISGEVSGEAVISNGAVSLLWYEDGAFQLKRYDCSPAELKAYFR